MELYSTAHRSPNVSFKEALFKGLPSDNGLYLPTEIPKLPTSFFSSLSEMPFQEMAYEISKHLLSDEIAAADLREIIGEAFDFPVPTYQLDSTNYILELFHGPTFAFKDFGARFMSRMMGYYLETEQKEITILVATSGDTGGAVGSGFLGVPGVNVVILYPEGKISDIQESQLTTLGHNVRALKVNGTFDDCQALVKKAFLDPELKEANLSSANSINISRLIPQSFYYFKAVADMMKAGVSTSITFSVPSGNLGNLCGGILAYKMGLNINHFVASTNSNDTFPSYLQTGNYEPKPSVMTRSNAMDVGAPSNFARIASWFSKEEMNKLISGYSFTDDQTLEMIREVYFSKNYLMCPHTAVGYAGLKKYQKTDQAPGVVLSTAHPAKFEEAIIESIQKGPEMPKEFREISQKQKSFTRIDSSFDELKTFLKG